MCGLGSHQVVPLRKGVLSWRRMFAQASYMFSGHPGVGGRSEEINEDQTLRITLKELGFDPENRRAGEAHGDMFQHMFQYFSVIKTTTINYSPCPLGVG